MFNFNNYVDGAKPWVIASWCFTSLLAICFVYTLFAVLPIEFIPNMLPFNPYVALAVPILAPMCMVLNSVLKIWGGYMEVNSFQCASSKKYGSRFSFSLTIFFLNTMFSTLLVVDGLIPETWIVSAYVYSSALSFILFWVLRWMLVNQFQERWEKFRLLNEKDRLWSIVSAITCTTNNPLNDHYLSQLDSLEKSLKKSSDYDQVKKAVVAVCKLAGALDSIDEILKPEKP